MCMSDINFWWKRALKIYPSLTVEPQMNRVEELKR